MKLLKFLDITVIGGTGQEIEKIHLIHKNVILIGITIIILLTIILFYIIKIYKKISYNK